MITENGEDTRSHLIINNARLTDSGQSKSLQKNVHELLHLLMSEDAKRVSHNTCPISSYKKTYLYRVKI